MFTPSNAFSSLVIEGLIKHNNVHIPLTCFRASSIPAVPVIPSVECYRRAEGVPVRPPSKLPPLGELCLYVSMEPERLGYGRVGAVYPIRIDNPNQFSLPPLVIKVAARRRSENLAREAWFYEEMEHLQGVAIARCYGLFTTEIDPKSDVLGWAESDANYVPDDVEIPYENEDTGDIPPETLDAIQ